MMAQTIGRKADDAKRRERARVAAILKRDAADRIVDDRRDTANREIAQGRFVNLADTVDTLPREQLERGEFVPVEVDNPEGTVRDRRRTIRRVTRIAALHQRGVLDDDGYAGCAWYRDQWERSGLDPLIASTFDPKFGSGEADYGHLPRTEAQAIARDEYRWARTYVPDDVRDLFERIVLEDLTVRQAAELTRCRYANAVAAFRRGVFALMEYTVPTLLRTATIKRPMR